MVLATTHVAGFTRWKKLRRHVKKGERGIAILAPLLKCRKVEETKDDGTKDSVKVRALNGFRVIYVFDVTQTEGEELPKFATLSGDPGNKLEKLEAVIRENGISLEYADSLSGALGVSEGGKIQVLSELEPAEKFSVLAHEYGHELLHRGSRRKETTVTVRETEAEAVAFVVSQASGLDCSTRSSDYIQLYDGDREVLKESLDQIQPVASSILSELESVTAETGQLEMCR